MQVISGCCILQTSFFSAETSIHIDWHDWQSSNPMHPNSCQLVSVSWSSCQHPAAHSWQPRIHSDLSAAQLFFGRCLRLKPPEANRWNQTVKLLLLILPRKNRKKTMEFIRSDHGWSYDIFWCLILFITNPYSPMFLYPFDPLKTQLFHLTVAEEPHLCRTDDLSRTKAIWGVDSRRPPTAAICWKFGKKMLSCGLITSIKWHESSRFYTDSTSVWRLLDSIGPFSLMSQMIIPYIFSSQEAEWMPGPKVMTWQQWKWWKSGEICTVTVK